MNDPEQSPQAPALDNPQVPTTPSPELSSDRRPLPVGAPANLANVAFAPKRNKSHKGVRFSDTKQGRAMMKARRTVGRLKPKS